VKSALVPDTTKFAGFGPPGPGFISQPPLPRGSAVPAGVPLADHGSDPVRVLLERNRMWVPTAVIGDGQQ
jgi:hypothetical protein